jgi:hypothetical protein
VGEFTSAERALVAVHHAVRMIGPDDLHRPTPCLDWDVEALAEHLVDTISRPGVAAGIGPTVADSESVDACAFDQLIAFTGRDPALAG